MRNFLSHWIVMTAILVFSFIAWSNAVAPVSADSSGSPLVQNDARQ
ncbi:MAG TPA: hypothetical protein VK791_04135 [bacterium]|nr:hypothetical protein [bacterium]